MKVWVAQFTTLCYHELISDDVAVFATEELAKDHLQAQKEHADDLFDYCCSCWEEEVQEKVCP
tara:strand:+ start:54 stop:242 length:189 start_codon:yes stop_codon:yes gene_type:complete